MFTLFLVFASSVLLCEAQDFNTYPGYVTVNHEINKYNDQFNDMEEHLSADDILAPYTIFSDEDDDELEFDWLSDELDAISDVLTSEIMYRRPDPVAAPYGFLDDIIKNLVCQKVGQQMCQFLDPIFPCLKMQLALQLKSAAEQGKIALLKFILNPDTYNALSPCLGNCTKEPYRLAVDAYNNNGMLGLLNVTLGVEMYEVLSPCLGNCTRDIYRLVVDSKSRQKYAITALDSFGKPAANILGGNVQWLGDMNECQSVHAVIPNDTENPHLYNDFTGKYCTTKLEHIGKKQAKIRIGLCLPNTCHEDDIPTFLRMVIKKLKSNITIAEARCPAEIPYSHGDYIMIILCVVIGTLVIVGTLYDAVRRLMDAGEEDDVTDAKKLERSGKNNISAIYDPDRMTSDPDAILVHNDSVEMHQERALDAHVRHVQGRLSGQVPDETPAWETEYKAARDGKPCCDVKGCMTSCSKSFMGVIGDLLMAFSIFANGERLLDTTQTVKHACAVDGIRVLTSGWVVLGHTFIAIIVYLANSVEFMKEMKTFWFQPIVNTALAADSFFVLGGFLVAYLTLLQLKKERFLGVNWVGFYLHRIWRITPTFMFVLFFWSTLFVHLPQGPLADTVKDIPRYASCSKYWWANLLYVHNFVPGNPSEACMGWTWYLADDMQFFILSPIFIIGLYKLWKVFVPVMSALVAACVVLTGLYSRYLEKDWTNPMANGVGQIIQGGTLDVQWSRMFVRPYYRVAPYLVGMITAYIVYRTNTVDIRKAKWWKKVLLIVFWLVVFALCGMCVYGMTGHYEFKDHFPVNMSATYLSASRFVFSACLALTLLACNMGLGGPVNWFLSWSGFRPLARLSFIVYLVHPLVIQVSYKSRQIPYYMTDSDMTYIFIGHLVLSYMAALVIHLAIEAPCAALERTFRKRWNKRTQSRDTELTCCC